MDDRLTDLRGRNRRRLTLVLALTSVYLVAEVLAGLMTRSLALLADAGHMLTDVAGLALALEIHHVTVQVEGGGCPDETTHL